VKVGILGDEKLMLCDEITILGVEIVCGYEKNNFLGDVNDEILIFRVIILIFHVVRMNEKMKFLIFHVVRIIEKMKFLILDVKFLIYRMIF